MLGLPRADEHCAEAAAHHADLRLRAPDQVRPGRRVVTSWTIHALPSGSRVWIFNKLVQRRLRPESRILKASQAAGLSRTLRTRGRDKQKGSDSRVWKRYPSPPLVPRSWQ